MAKHPRTSLSEWFTKSRATVPPSRETVAGSAAISTSTSVSGGGVAGAVVDRGGADVLPGRVDAASGGPLLPEVQPADPSKMKVTTSRRMAEYRTEEVS